MTEHTDETNEGVSASPRTIQAGDIVAHVDVPYCILGNVYAVQDGQASVDWSGTDMRDGVPVERLRLIQRPDAYVCVSYEGHDEVTGERNAYRFVHTSDYDDTTDQVVEDIAFYGKTAGYIIVDSYVPTAPDQDDGTAC